MFDSRYLAERLILILLRVFAGKAIQHAFEVFRRLLHVHSVDLENADPGCAGEFLSDLDRFQHSWTLCHHRGSYPDNFSHYQILPQMRACASPLSYGGLRGLFLAGDLHLSLWVPSGENYAELANRGP